MSYYPTGSGKNRNVILPPLGLREEYSAAEAFSNINLYSWATTAITTVQCLAREDKYFGCSQDSNPHYDDSALTSTTQVRCTKPLRRGIPWQMAGGQEVWSEMQPTGTPWISGVNPYRNVVCVWGGGGGGGGENIEIRLHNVERCPWSRMSLNDRCPKKII